MPFAFLTRRNVWILAAMGFVVAFPSGLYAEPVGEIININHQYQLAFSDAASDKLRRKDIVQVYFTVEDFVYLEVLDSSPILSKLVPIKKGGYRTDLNDFEKIAVGNRVHLLNMAREPEPAFTQTAPLERETPPPANRLNELETALSVAQSRITALEQENRTLQQRNTELRSVQNTMTDKERTAYEDEITALKRMIAGLRTRLENMSNILNKR